MKSIVVSGAGGQLGSAFVSSLPFADGYSVYSFDRSQLDISDREKIRFILDTLPQVKYWINCAAYTRVDDAETYVREATLDNAIAPGFIAGICKERGLHLFHFSSDYVYHNDLRRPLKEDDPTEPKGIYAQSKWEGELEIQHTGASHTIIRTSWVYGPNGHNFVNTMLRIGKMKEEISVVGDQLGAPTYTHDVVRAVKELLDLHATGHTGDIQGIFNFANVGQVTWDDFARTIFKHAGLSCHVNTITSAEYGAPAPRPPYSVLNCDKIQSLLSFPIPHWEDALQRYLNSMV